MPAISLVSDLPLHLGDLAGDLDLEADFDFEGDFPPFPFLARVGTFADAQPSA